MRTHFMLKITFSVAFLLTSILVFGQQLKLEMPAYFTVNQKTYEELKAQKIDLIHYDGKDLELNFALQNYERFRKKRAYGIWAGVTATIGLPYLILGTSKRDWSGTYFNGELSTIAGVGLLTTSAIFIHKTFKYKDKEDEALAMAKRRYRQLGL